MKEKIDILLKCPVLGYSLVTETELPDYAFGATSKSKFERDIEALLDNGYTPISFDQLVNFRFGKAELPDKPVCIVFKGGYRNIETTVLPITQEYCIPIAIFLSAENIGKTDAYSGEDFLDWNDINNLSISNLISFFPTHSDYYAVKRYDGVHDEELQKVFDYVLKCFPSLFSMMHETCTEDEAEEFHKRNVQAILIDCNRISQHMFDLCAIPCMSVVHSVFVLDAIERYRYECREFMEKDQAYVASLDKYVKPAANVIQESVCLPIDTNPRVRLYLRHAYAFSILQAHRKDKAERLLMDEFIDVVYKPLYNTYDFHNEHYERWECFDCRKITPEIIQANNINIIEYIINGLKCGYYSDIWLDTYYIPHKPSYKKLHTTHGLLIYAFDADSKTFKAMSYDNAEHYVSIDVPMKCVYRGCTNRYFIHLSLIRCSDTPMPAYDRARMKRKLQNYLDSVCFDDGQVRFNKYCPIQVCNYEANLRFEVEFKSRGVDQKIHMTSLYGFAEYKLVMLWRINKVCELEKLKLPNIESIEDEYSKKAHYLINAGLKFKIAPTSKLFESILSTIHYLNETEKKLIESLLSQI